LRAIDRGRRRPKDGFGSIDPSAGAAVGERPLFAHSGRLESTSSGHCGWRVVYCTSGSRRCTGDKDFVGAIQAGINIIHVNTELRVAWRRGLEKGLAADTSEVAPYKILPDAIAAVEDVVKSRLRLFSGCQ
jgi:fructose/tagatose bisphosphate aldolase